ncbi:hypothetical protein D3C80_2224870 [compost metagenome]
MKERAKRKVKAKKSTRRKKRVLTMKNNDKTRVKQAVMMLRRKLVWIERESTGKSWTAV